MNKKISYGEIFKSGLLTNNPTLVQLIGMCPTLAVTTSVVNALGMGVAVIIVLTCSNLFISLLRKIIPNQVRIAAYIVVISGFVTAVELLLKAYFPAISASLGLFIPLIVVNCIILARAEAFASKNTPLASVCDGLAMGAGFTCALTVIGFIRELIGTGKIFAASDGTGGITILSTSWYTPANIFIMPAGAFITLACVVAVAQKLRNNVAEKEQEEAEEVVRLQMVEHLYKERNRRLKEADALGLSDAEIEEETERLETMKAEIESSKAKHRKGGRR